MRDRPRHLEWATLDVLAAELDGGYLVGVLVIFFAL